LSFNLRISAAEAVEGHLQMQRHSLYILD